MLRLPGFVKTYTEDLIEVFVTCEIKSLNKFLPNTTAIKNFKKRNVSYEYLARQWSAYKRQWKAALTILPSVEKNKRKVDTAIISHRTRLIDVENLYGGSKPIRDVLQSMGYLYDDSPKWGSLQVTQEKVDKGDKGTWIILRKSNE